jgi:hypothetical protein
MVWLLLTSVASFFPGLPVAVFGDETRVRLNEESWEMRLNIPGLSLDSLGESREITKRLPLFKIFLGCIMSPRG